MALKKMHVMVEVDFDSEKCDEDTVAEMVADIFEAGWQQQAALGLIAPRHAEYGKFEIGSFFPYPDPDKN